MFEIINSKEEIPELKDVKKVLDLAIQKEKVEDAYFTLIIVDNAEIQKINREYRKKDRPTDVITFALEDNAIDPNLPIRLLGEIYLSIDQAKIQATEYQHSLKRELCFLAVHGFHHLLGYDHMTKEEEKRMFQKQEEVLNEAQITR